MAALRIVNGQPVLVGKHPGTGKPMEIPLVLKDGEVPLKGDLYSLARTFGVSV